MYRFIALFVVVVFLFFPRVAAAYVDPGLGGQIFQAAYLFAIGAAGFIVAPFFLFGRTMVRIVRRMFRCRGIVSPEIPPITPPNT